MNVFYWDTSAILPLIYLEKQSHSLLSWAKRNKSLPGYTSFFSFVEMESAHHRRLSEGILKQKDLAHLRIREGQVSESLALLWADREVLDDALRVTGTLGLKPGDALQLASALVLKQESESVTFVCLDQRLRESAKAIGLVVVDDLK